MTNCLESYTVRELYNRGLLISRNVGGNCEFGLVVSKDILTVVGLIKFINDKYCTAFRSCSSLRKLLTV